MKNNNLIKYSAVMLAMVAATACHNGDQEFDDYDGGTTVYFAYQTPVRTLVMGEDLYNTDNDNAHKCQIFSVSGGTYNGISAKVDFKVDESLVEGLYFDAKHTNPVLAMPSDYYTLSSNTLEYSGSQKAHIDVQFSDKFFEDEKSLSNNYVIPLKMVSVSGADGILEARNYTLYCVKYICKYHANFLRRGYDEFTYTDGEKETATRHNGVENDDVVSTSTKSLSSVTYPVTAQLKNGTQVTCNLLLSFSDDGKCTISGDDNYTASGTGHYDEKSEIKAWGNKDRDGLYLDYTIDFGEFKQATKDTLVLQCRGVASETFTTYTAE